VIVSFLAAMDQNLVIGDDKGIPWHLPADLMRFRRLTLGKPIVMGRTTFEHIGKPLDKRVNIVLSRRADFGPKGLLIARSMDEAIQLAGDVPEVVVIGGGGVFAAALPLVTRMCLTFVDGEFAGTAHFPALIPTPRGFAWTVVHLETHPADEKNRFAHHYIVVERAESPGSAGDGLNIARLAATR
jgi:dihydrofolate reductase